MKREDWLSREWLTALQASIVKTVEVCAKQSARARTKGDMDKEFQWLERAGFWREFNERVQQHLERLERHPNEQSDHHHPDR